MSLKLDELRKRLLQQQAGSDAPGADTPSSMSGGRSVGVAAQKATEIEAVPKAAEPPAFVKTTGAAKTSEVLIYWEGKVG